MQPQTIHTHVFNNGLTLLVEPMDNVRSAAFTFLVPAGCIHENERANGTAAILSDLITRGAGERDSRELLAALDHLGVQASENSGTSHLSLSGATLAANIPAVLELYGDILLRPHLSDDQFPYAQAGVEQSLRAQEDEPQQKIMPELKRRCYNAPWGRPTDGTLEDLPNITAESTRTFFQEHVGPRECILGVAGNVDFETIRDTVGRLFNDWEPQPADEIVTGDRGQKVDHITHDSEQTHIALAFQSVAVPDPDYYTAWAAAAVLGSGSSSRLFTEVREKRGLCYSISANLSGLRHDGRVFCYAGTSNQRAQETLDVTLAEITRLQQGITQAELSRCQAMAKSALVMSQESTRGRSWSIASNWYFLGRTKTLAEVKERIDALTVADIQEFLNRRPATDFTILTLGPQPLEIPDALS